MTKKDLIQRDSSMRRDLAGYDGDREITSDEIRDDTARELLSAKTRRDRLMKSNIDPRISTPYWMLYQIAEVNNNPPKFVSALDDLAAIFVGISGKRTNDLLELAKNFSKRSSEDSNDYADGGWTGF